MKKICKRKAREVKGYPKRYIKKINVDLAAQQMTLVWAGKPPVTGLNGPYKVSTGAGKCGKDCNDKATSRVLNPDPWCYQQRKKNKKKYDVVRRLKKIIKVSKTKKTGSTSKNRYGFSFYHFFKTKPKSCNILGAQLSKSVKIKRDDFSSGASSRPRGSTVWSLTGKKRLKSSDSVQLGGGSKGLGSQELKKWPAVMESKHTWHYRLSKFRPWVSGPSINIKMILKGNRKDKKKLSVKTTVNGVSLSQKYTGPMPIRIKKPKAKQKP